MISKRIEYAIRAVIELGYRKGESTVKAHQIASAQNIPLRFLEAILNQLKNAGYVKSKRGKEGGYQIILDLSEITVGDIIKAVGGTKNLENKGEATRKVVLRGDRALEFIEEKINRLLNEVYSTTTLGDLLKIDMEQSLQQSLHYMI